MTHLDPSLDPSDQATRQQLRMLKAFSRIADPTVRDALLNLVEACAATGQLGVPPGSRKPLSERS